MKLSPFRIERFYARYEHSTRFMLSSSDSESRTVAELGPGASVSAALAAANWPDSREPVMLVGHQPTLGMIASFLLSGEEAYWSVRKGAVWWLSNRVRDGGSAIPLRSLMP